MSSLTRVLLWFAFSIVTGCALGPDGPESGGSQEILTPGGMVTLPATGFGDSGVTTTAPPPGWATGSVAWCCTNWWVPIPVSAGDVVGSVAALVQDVAPAPLCVPGSGPDCGSSVILSVVAQTGATSTTLGTASSNGSGTQQSLIVTLANSYTVPAGTSIVVKAQAFALWPSVVMHSSIIGPVTTAAPAALAGPPRVRPISGLTVVPEWPAQGIGATRVANTWSFSNSRYMYFPVPVTPGEVIVGYQVYVNKNSSSAFSVISDLIKVDSATAQQTVLGSASNSSNSPGRIVLSPAAALSAVTPASATYLIRISGASTSDSFTDAALILN